jgi:hypothetical protein
MNKLQSLKALLCAAGLAVASLSQAGVVPVGIQSNVSNATVAGWGWTECHRSSASSNVSIASILGGCSGTHLMMGYAVNGAYAILGAGDYATVTAITFADYGADDNGTTLNNWSNGLNFYRTASYGSWGFTTNSKTELNSADIFLLDGLQSQNGQTEDVLSAGLSFHLGGSNDVNGGWAYNVTGSNFASMGSGDRVFLQYTANEVPEPGVFLLFGIGLLGLGLARRRG